jgi:hypothetical protein
MKSQGGGRGGIISQAIRRCNVSACNVFTDFPIARGETARESSSRIKLRSRVDDSPGPTICPSPLPSPLILSADNAYMYNDGALERAGAFYYAGAVQQPREACGACARGINSVAPLAIRLCSRPGPFILA